MVEYQGMRWLKSDFQVQTPEDNRRAMEEAIQSDLKEFKTIIPRLRKSLDKKYVTVIGNSATIDKNKDLFDAVRSLKN